MAKKNKFSEWDKFMNYLKTLDDEQMAYKSYKSNRKRRDKRKLKRKPK